MDGFNLYFGIKSLNNRKYYWVDLVKLTECILGKKYLNEKVEQITCKYFTAITKRTDQGGRNRQEAWLDACRAYKDRGLKLDHNGFFFLERILKCDSCGVGISKWREKRTDVNLAVSMMKDFYENEFDLSILISSDSDFIAAVEGIEHPKKILVAHPPRKERSDPTKPGKLGKSANEGVYQITEEDLRECLLPLEIKYRGKTIRCPERWR